MTTSIARAGRDALAWARTAVEKADDMLTEWIGTGRVDHLEDRWQDLREALTGSTPRFEELEAALIDPDETASVPATTICDLVWKDMSRGKERSEFAYSGKLTVGFVGTSCGRRDEFFFQMEAVHTRYITKGEGKAGSLEEAKAALTASWHEWLRHAGLMPTTTTDKDEG